VTTVSRALTDPELVRPSTRERVVATAQRLAYHPNLAARSLITGKTAMIGIIVPDVANPFYPGVLRGVQAAAHEVGYSVLLADSEESPVAEESLVRSMARQVDGIIVCGSSTPSARLRDIASETNLVLLNRRIPSIPAVLMDISRGAQQAIDHLALLGHRSIVFLGGPANAWPNQQRRLAIAKSAERHGMSLRELGPVEPNFEGGVRGAELAFDCGATALLAYNDLMALGVMRAMASRGIRVPLDMSVIGFDDIIYATMCAPPLTTVAMPMEAAGRAAAETLLDDIKGRTPRSRPPAEDASRLHSELIIRGTTGPAKQ
jgi:DNA-binding LacI/PurR family transcriptional regulator